MLFVLSFSFSWSYFSRDKAMKLQNKFCISNKIKEVSDKVLRIYPVKLVLERLKLNISYTCECGQEFCDFFFPLHTIIL